MALCCGKVVERSEKASLTKLTLALSYLTSAFAEKYYLVGSKELFDIQDKEYHTTQEVQTLVLSHIFICAIL